MSLFIEYTPLGLIMLAIGYLFQTRPTRHEVTAKQEYLEKDVDWIKNAMWGLAQKHGVDVVPPPERDEKTG